MNIAIFASAFHPSLGGVEEFCRQISHAYIKQGHRVLILTNRWPRTLPVTENFEGIAVHRLPFRVAGNSFKSKITARLTARIVCRKMRGILDLFQPDILHVHCVSSNALYALHARNSIDKPLVVSLHGELTMDATGLFQNERWAQQALRTVLEEADKITACSRQTLEEAEAWFGKSFDDRASVIYNGIDCSEMSEAKPYLTNRPYILAIGRFAPQKGFAILLEAMATAIQDSQFTHDLILAGDGMENTLLRSLAEQLNLGDRVHFPGRVDHQNAIELFKGCSFFVLSSLHEPFGIVNLEAMAAGKAVLATNVGGVPEVVENGRSGILVSPNDQQALATGMTALAKDPVLCEKLGAEGRIRAEQFDWESIAKKHIDLYEEIHANLKRRIVLSTNSSAT